MMPAVRALVALTMLALASAPSGAPALLPPRWSRAQMEARLEPAGRFIVVCGTRDPAATSSLRLRAIQLARWLAAGDSSAVLSDVDATRAALTGRAIALVGGPSQNAWT